MWYNYPDVREKGGFAYDPGYRQFAMPYLPPGLDRSQAYQGRYIVPPPAPAPAPAAQLPRLRGGAGGAANADAMMRPRKGGGGGGAGGAGGGGGGDAGEEYRAPPTGYAGEYLPKWVQRDWDSADGSSVPPTMSSLLAQDPTPVQRGVTPNQRMGSVPGGYPPVLPPVVPPVFPQMQLRFESPSSSQPGSGGGGGEGTSMDQDWLSQANNLHQTFHLLQTGGSGVSMQDFNNAASDLRDLFLDMRKRLEGSLRGEEWSKYLDPDIAYPMRDDMRLLEEQMAKVVGQMRKMLGQVVRTLQQKDELDALLIRYTDTYLAIDKLYRKHAAGLVHAELTYAVGQNTFHEPAVPSGSDSDVIFLAGYSQSGTAMNGGLKSTYPPVGVGAKHGAPQNQESSPRFPLYTPKTSIRGFVKHSKVAEPNAWGIYRNTQSSDGGNTAAVNASRPMEAMTGANRAAASQSEVPSVQTESMEYPTLGSQPKRKIMIKKWKVSPSSRRLSSSLEDSSEEDNSEEEEEENLSFVVSDSSGSNPYVPGMAAEAVRDAFPGIGKGILPPVDESPPPSAQTNEEAGAASVFANLTARRPSRSPSVIPQTPSSSPEVETKRAQSQRKDDIQRELRMVELIRQGADWPFQRIPTWEELDDMEKMAQEYAIGKNAKKGRRRQRPK